LSLYSGCHAAPKAERRDVGDSWYLDCAMLVAEATAPFDIPMRFLKVSSNVSSGNISGLEISEPEASVPALCIQLCGLMPRPVWSWLAIPSITSSFI